jgi:hypothetical protein
MSQIILRREGRDDVVREVDQVDPAVAEFIVLSEHEREVYHFDGNTYEGDSAVYQYKGTDESHYPKTTGG